MLTLRAKPQTHIRLVSLQTCSLSETVVNIYPPGTVTAVLQVLSVLMADISLSQKYRLPVTITPATEPAAQRQTPPTGHRYLLAATKVRLGQILLWAGFNHLEICKTNKTVVQSSSFHSDIQFAIVAIWEYYPPEDIDATHRKKHLPFKNCQHQATSKTVSLQSWSVSFQQQLYFILDINPEHQVLSWNEGLKGFIAEKVKVKYSELIKRAFQLFSIQNFIRIMYFSNSRAANEMDIFPKKSNYYHFPKEMGKKFETLFQNFLELKSKEHYLQTEGK